MLHRLPTCLALLLLIAPAAHAKTICGALDPTSPFPFYVLEKVKTKIGSHGAAHGYLVNADGTDSAPFSTSWAVYNDQYVNVSATWGTTQGYFGYPVWTFNFGAPFTDGGTAGGYMTLVDGFDGSITNIGTFDVAWADCKDVPKFPVPAP
jgi:hypothetical protein